MAVGIEAPHHGRPEVLHGSSQAFGSASDFAEVAELASRLVHSAIDSVDASVRIVLPDSMGRLRVASTDHEAGDTGRRRSARRRAAFEAGTPVRLDLDGPDGESLAILPLACRGDSVGVLEVVARRDAVETYWDALEVVAGQV